MPFHPDVGQSQLEAFRLGAAPLGGDGGDGGGRDFGTKDNPISPNYDLPGFVRLPLYNEHSGEFVGWETLRDPTFGTGTGSGAASPQFRPGELALLQAELAERERSSRVQEAQGARRITLDRALGGLNAFNQSRTLADNRRLSAFQEARQLMGLLVPKGTTEFPGLGAGGALAQVSQNFNLPFTPSPVVEREFNPQALATPAEGNLPFQIGAMLRGVGQI
ncbi:hypothetical protein LCGC14_0410310 [marine sediment metagenome]|uniref:Uncharacterized protein n=1 Tax=marine sediment metagenome TaxID=412755 RepID=A0A0F9TC66_9ZZZZ